MSMRVRIENVTASTHVKGGFDLVEFQNMINDETEDASSRMVIRYSESIAVQLYENGNVVSTGSRSTREARASICDVLMSVGISLDPDDVQIRDIMASSFLDNEVNLERAYVILGESAEYNPEWFTGVIVHMDGIGCTGMVYSGGKIVVSGCKDMDSVYAGLGHIIKVLSDIDETERRGLMRLMHLIQAMNKM